LLLRILLEARPDDLGDAVPRFVKYLEGLAGMDRALEPLLPALVTWPLPPLVKVLDRWSQKAASAAFRNKTALAADGLRVALGAVGSEIAPAGRPEEKRREAVPASLTCEDETEGAAPGHEMAPEVIPAARPRGEDPEPAAARAPRGDGDEPAPAERGGP
jgi:hypothetical protein